MYNHIYYGANQNPLTRRSEEDSSSDLRSYFHQWGDVSQASPHCEKISVFLFGTN